MDYCYNTISYYYCVTDNQLSNFFPTKISIPIHVVSEILLSSSKIKFKTFMYLRVASIVYKPVA
jgi:hypothetical protein